MAFCFGLVCFMLCCCGDLLKARLPLQRGYGSRQRQKSRCKFSSIGLVVISSIDLLMAELLGCFAL